MHPTDKPITVMPAGTCTGCGSYLVDDAGRCKGCGESVEPAPEEPTDAH